MSTIGLLLEEVSQTTKRLPRHTRSSSDRPRWFSYHNRGRLYGVCICRYSPSRLSNLKSPKLSVMHSAIFSLAALKRVTVAPSAHSSLPSTSHCNAATDETAGITGRDSCRTHGALFVFRLVHFEFFRFDDLLHLAVLRHDAP